MNITTATFTREEIDVLLDAQHTISVRARLLWHALETHARPNADTTYDAMMHEGLLALVTEITTAAAALETLATPRRPPTSAPSAWLPTKGVLPAARPKKGGR